MSTAWHFVRDSGLLLDHTPMVIGKKLIHTGPLELCAAGYHASTRAIDALDYAPGSIICRVDVGGEILHDNDKLVARERTVIWSYDATEILRFFARQCALAVIHLWDAPDVVREFLETGDESLRAAAGDAAWNAARNATGDAAWNAARSAARAAAWDAAWDAAWAARSAAGDAAWNAARSAAGAAAWNAARSAARDATGAAARSAARSAAWNAAWDAALAATWAAARAAQNRLLESLFFAGAQDLGIAI